MKTWVKACFWYGLLATLLWGTSVHAQTAPDAGALRQQLERNPAQPLPARAQALEQAGPAALSLPDGLQITVQSFRFEGLTLLPQGALTEVVAPYLNRPLGFADLQQVSQNVADLFRRAGWIVSTYLPKQDVTEGQVTIGIVEAVFTGTRIEGPQPTRVAASRVLNRVMARQKPGQKINAFALDHGLLLADDLPGVSVAGALEPGQRDGETALVLRTSDEPAFSGQLNLDNGGSRSTGAYRLTAQGQVNSPLGLGDQLRGQAAVSEGSRYARLAYDLPVGALGTRLGGSLSSMNYRLTGADFAALGSRGWSSSAGLEVTHPLLRTRQKNLFLNTSYDIKRYANQAGGVRQSGYTTSGLTAALSGNLFDDLGGGGANSLSLAVNSGRVQLGEPDPGDRPESAGHYTKLQFTASRRQSLRANLDLQIQLRGQWADSTLDSSEKFYLGGPEGVRAYPANEGSGSTGQVGSLDLRWQATPQWSASAFADVGRADNRNGTDTTLKGAGVAVAWTGPRALTARVSVAQRIGQNPNPTASGRDQDGSLVRTRVWAQVSLPF